MNKDKMRTMADRVFRDMAGGMAAGLAFVGTETGLFRAMSGRGAMMLVELGRRRAFRRLRAGMPSRHRRHESRQL